MFIWFKSRNNNSSIFLSISKSSFRLRRISIIKQKSKKDNYYSSTWRVVPWFFICTLPLLFIVIKCFFSSSVILVMVSLLFTILIFNSFISETLPISSSLSKRSKVSLYPFGRLLSNSSGVGSPFTGCWGTTSLSIPYVLRFSGISYTASLLGYYYINNTEIIILNNFSYIQDALLQHFLSYPSSRHLEAK